MIKIGLKLCEKLIWKNSYLCTLASNGFQLTNIAPTRALADTSSSIDQIIVKKIHELNVKTLDDVLLIIFRYC